MSVPTITRHLGVDVVRDDLFLGGTKARAAPLLFTGQLELVYASPAEGGAQTALATVAAALGKKVTIFVAKRAVPHPRLLMARRLGANVVEVRPGHLSVVRARAREYCEKTGAHLLPFGVNIPPVVDAIAEAAASAKVRPGEVWFASGSGTLARALAKAWPHARRFAVQVGRELSLDEVGGAQIIRSQYKFSAPCKSAPPFPSDQYYAAKAWEVCVKLADRNAAPLFWNVTGEASVDG